MDLRDRFAAQFAAALVDAFDDADHIARRAYDLAEAMLSERARRIDADEEGAILVEPRDAAPSIAPPATASAPPVDHGHHAALLDEPEPMFEPDLVYDEDDLDPALLEPPYDPAWDLDARLVSLPSGAASSRPPGPGLARTQPNDGAEDAARKERSA